MKNNRTKVFVLALLVSFTSPLQVNQKSYASDVLNPDMIDEIVDGKNEFTKLAMKQDKQNSKSSAENIQITEGNKEKDLDSEQAEIEEASKKASDTENDGDTDDDGGHSFKSMLAEKKQLTQEVRNANITEQDMSFMDEFSQAMTENGTKKAEGYQPSDKEISQDLNKAH